MGANRNPKELEVFLIIKLTVLNNGFPNLFLCAKNHTLYCLLSLRSHVQNNRSDIPNLLNCCVIFIVNSEFTDVAVGLIIHGPAEIPDDLAT